MTCSPSQTAHPPAVSDGRSSLRRRAVTLLARYGASIDTVLGSSAARRAEPACVDPACADPAFDDPQDAELGGDVPADAVQSAALATALMDVFRRSSDPEVFECLVQWVGPQLYARVRSRLRCLGAQYDPQEILQDTFVNIYRYPDRFLASRPGAFAAWSSTIVDNAIRRQLRSGRRAVEVAFRSPDVLEESADHFSREPSLQAQDHEECAAAVNAYGLLLQCYLIAFRSLNDRERFVLQMVEVRRLRYGELAASLGIRPEALKMVVFRARKRIHDRVAGLLGSSRKAVDEPVLARV